MRQSLLFSWCSKPRITLVLITLNIAILSLVGILYGKAVSTGRYLPVTQDECTYYNSARIFCETGSVKAVTSLYGERSRIGETHWYGPAFHLIYGSICKLFGISGISFITIHLFFMFLSIAIILLFKLNAIDKLLFLTIYLSSYVSYSFVFTYFPEIIQITLTLTLLLLYTRVKNRKTFVVFAMAILLASIVRVTSVIWVFTFPFLEFAQLNRTKRIFIGFGSIILVFLYMKYFTAPAVAKGISSIHGGADVSEVWDKVMAVLLNIRTNLKIGYNYLFYHQFGFMNVLSVVLVFILAITSFFSEKSVAKRNVVAGILLMSLATFLLFMSLYTYSMIYIEKQIGFLLPGLIYCCVFMKRNMLFTFVIAIFIFLPFSYSKAQKNIQERRECFDSVQLHKREITEFVSFIEHVDNSDREIRVALDFYEFGIPNDMILFYLPVSKNGTPVTYLNTLPTGVNSIRDSMDLFRGASYDYLLSKKEYGGPKFRRIYENASVKVYRREK